MVKSELIKRFQNESKEIKRQLRVADMDLGQLKSLLLRREKGILFLKFLISQKEAQ